jgi:hypothetical protein
VVVEGNSFLDYVAADFRDHVRAAQGENKLKTLRAGPGTCRRCLPVDD